MVNDGRIISNWFGDQRVFNDGVGGRSEMAQLNWDATFGGQVQLRLRNLQNQVYGQYPYHHFHEASLTYARPWKGVIVGGEIDAGTDVFGKSFSRIAGFVRYDDPNAHSGLGLLDSEHESADPETRGQFFVGAGVSAFNQSVDLTGTTPKTLEPDQWRFLRCRCTSCRHGA